MPLRALVLLGRTIRRLRKQRGLSQMKLAELAGVHLNEISNVERGERDARITSLLKIARGEKLKRNWQWRREKDLLRMSGGICEKTKPDFLPAAWCGRFTTPAAI